MGMMIHLLIRCVIRVRPDEHTTFHLAMLSDPRAPFNTTCTTLMGQPQRHRTVSDNTVI
jgi:hypothetical protein